MLFNDSISTSSVIQYRMIRGEDNEWRRGNDVIRRSWPISRYCPVIRLRTLRATTKNSILDSRYFKLLHSTYLLTYLHIPYCRILFEKLIVTQHIKKYPAFFMESEVSSPCLQKPVTGPYPETAESSSPHRSLSPYGLA
jgi:hypothetical protein